MATCFVAATTVGAVEKGKADILEGIGETLEGFMNGATEQTDHMDDVQWRNYNLSVSRAAQSNANRSRKAVGCTRVGR